VQLYPVVVLERPHETARWHSKPPLVEGDETNHIPWRRSRVGLARGCHPLWLRPTGEGTEQTIGNKSLQILHSDGRKAMGRAAERRSPCQPSLNEGGGGGGDKVRGFLFSGYSLRLRKPKQKASANGRVKNHRQPLFREYKGPGEIHSKLRPNSPRNSYPFPLPLSLSCYRDRVRGYFERDPSQQRKRAPEPSY
jgi:hypothetical protein